MLAKSVKCAAAAALLAVAFAGGALAQKTKLTVYTAIENEQLEPFKKAFEADNPTIEIAWVRDSTGVMTAKLIAEKDNPRADVVWGLAASSLGLMASMGMIEPYTPANAAARFDSILSPMASIASGFGPMKVTPAVSHAAANDGFSERKP